MEVRIKSLCIQTWNRKYHVSHYLDNLDFVREVPFDPFLPWIFMGEEVSLSARLWTSGYDIFSPSKSVTSHMYVCYFRLKLEFVSCAQFILLIQIWKT